MSGGVDSSVTAALLKKKGFEVQGFFMALSQPDLDIQIDRVKKIAEFLKLPLNVVDLGREFSKEVLDYCTETYFSGRTPNPCMICNYTIKFGRLLDTVLAKGLDGQATGHYARIIHEPGVGARLLKGKDEKKDQSYFLSRLTQSQITRMCLPLGEYSKQQVYQVAADIGLAGKHGKESQDVCFLQDQDVGTFLANRQGNPIRPGSVVTREGRQVGEHQGIHTFTIGQRRGLGIPDVTPYYVIALDVRENKVIVGKKSDLLSEKLTAEKINWLSGTAPLLPQKFEVKIRYRHQAAVAVVDYDIKSAKDRLIVRFDEPQMAVTPGQFVVFYQEDEVIGSGEICR